MPYEIERKFLVTGTFKNLAFRKSRIRQGYISTGKHATVRVRTKEDKGYITIKGKPISEGFMRYEWEKEIPFLDAEELLLLCDDSYVDKIRYEISMGNHIFEVDEFLGKNQGLLVAEIELKDEHEVFEKPNWLGMEVTFDKKYTNTHLAKHPFTEW